MAEKALQLLGAALDRQLQAIGGEDHPGAWSGKTQVLGKHHPIVFAVVRFGATQLDGQDRNAPPGQPASDPMDDHPVGEVGEWPTRLAFGLQQDDFRQALLDQQLGRQALEHQRQKAQHRLQCRRYRGLCHADPAQVGEAAGAQLARVHAEKLIVVAVRQQAPQPGVVTGRYAAVGLLQQPWGNSDLVQHLLGSGSRGATLQQRLTHQMNRDGVFFRHWPSLSPVLILMTAILGGADQKEQTTGSAATATPFRTINQNRTSANAAHKAAPCFAPRTTGAGWPDRQSDARRRWSC